MKKPDTSSLYEINEYGVSHHKIAADIPEDVIQYYKENYNINTELHKTCISCQIRQIEKYPNEKKFIVPCKGIPRGLPAGSAEKLEEIARTTNIPKEQAKKLMLATIDPAAWAELMFGFDDKDSKWKLRSYQKEQLRCTSKRIAIREGRRSGKTFMSALKLLYYAFNLKVSKGRDLRGNEVMLGPSIMIVTPYQAQLTNIFEEMEKLLNRNYELRSEVTTGTGGNLYVKTPTFKMEFRSQATITGFVSGIGMRQDGSGGGTMRGFSADIVYLDEMDMIPKDVLDKVINPILATTPDTMLIATSTPIGKKSKFYEWCLERPDFKEDFHPSSVIPHWEQIKEEIIRESTKESFMAEYMAVFVDSESGVFKSEWIQKARADYTYLESSSPGKIAQLGIDNALNRIVAIGIDWNKNAGTEFYVIAYYPIAQMWVALDAINIAHEEYSAKRWINELIKLNFKWKPNYIYADEGYGHTIIEDLRFQSYQLRRKPNKTAIDEETVMIADRLTSFNFSSNVELKDPVTNEIIKKPGKNFLVENAQRIFEENCFLFPAEDEKLKNQLQNYVITKRHPTTGKPVYGMINDRIGDHRLDAMMLALGALVLEESVYNGKSMMPSIPSFHKKGVQTEQYTSPNSEADERLEDMKKKGFPGQVNILKILRGGGSESEDKLAKEQYRKDGLPAYQTKKSEKDRSLIKEKEFSILEGIENWKQNPSQNNVSSFGVAPKRGRFGSKNRSW